ncbi:adenosylcobinamide-GDP ribazoletransferase [Roseibacterium sp. SDUM158016]|uniref:adenosylcobinamide-GDP ribazoletransferase n=1 Tax=Roseicyclus sediminis TaxID=2980997 RepID=UPI0021CFBF39|nr:adenosylcobinamide-GDP ribazoletransferase [Roseibacterium sp. SDUM158016]MCU4653650.1 adenosylcobinamide-GDP ribazoletransferase [Roseibacterium sp. SDUM158016]
MAPSSPPSTALIHPGDAGAALMLLTRLPVPGAFASDRGARAAWAWPLAGALVAALAWAAGAALEALGLPPVVAAGAALATLVVLTGGLHEDGLADCADGFWGGHTRARRMEILKDSRIGSYGVIALVLGLGMRWAAMTLLYEAYFALPAMLAAAMLSRATMAAVMGSLPFARQDGLAVHVGHPPIAAVALGVAVALGGSIVALGGAGLVPALAAGASASAVAAVARAKLGGQTGDVLGASQQAAEIAALLAVVSLVA